ncbi:glycosyltransferase [Arenibacter sp. GZD96]|uniref:glycosyltransferase n=1 Tax=Aurantibrevibacter litoralis TaxID=3106030 RepID=UPI002AFF5F50|nr:glycosyltransferase [Arenibacter sp. GZD-96]MEA1787683.1 glycosyltransferase [Arenibacter sp. GZD-96]
MLVNNWLFILPTDSVQGSEHIVQSLARHITLQSGICRVIILTKKNSLGWAADEARMLITYLPFLSYTQGILWLIPHLIFNFKTYKNIDYTFTSQTLINGSIGLAKRLGLLRNAKVVVRESNSIFELLQGMKLKIYTLFYTLGYKGASLVICQTNYMKEQLLKALPRLGKHLHIQVIPNPFNFMDSTTKIGELLPEYTGKRFLVAAGRLAPAKGFDLLIDAFHEIQKEHQDLHLIILGEGKDRELLMTKIRQLNLEGKIHMPGYVTNVYPYFKAAACCVLSSRIEGFPNVLLQMMSQNTKIVATLSAGDIDNIPGLFTCPTHDTAKLTATILVALGTDTEGNKPVFKRFLKERTQEGFYNSILNFTTTT